MKVFFFRGINFIAKWFNRIRCFLLGKKGVVLVFHEVSQDFENDQSCKIRVDTFKSIIERVSVQNQIVTVDEFLAKESKRAAVITFDDVPISFYKEAYPILKEKQIPFTLFVAKKFVDKEGFLSTEELKTLDKDPLCTIGAHTCNHTKMRYEKDSETDIKESKVFLETLLGHSVDYLAYPYGRYDSVSRKNRKEAKCAGFIAAFSTIPTAVSKKYNRMFIPRVEMIS